MKKTKILAVLGILLAMGITACQPAQNSSKAGGDQSQGGEASQPAGGSEEHKHVYGEWVQTKAPTCTEKGKEEQVCECGDKKERDVKALGHDWGEWTPKVAATCTADGSEERTCKRAGCGEKEERVVKAAHDWDADQDVAAGTDPADQVGYKLAVCKKGDAIKAEIKATDAKFYSGSIKSGTPSGYFKLASNNNQAYWKFTVAGTKMYKGMLYQRGAMDQFSGNTERTYAQTSTQGDHAPKYPLGNFDVVVNGDSVDKSQWIDVPYSELLADGEDSSAMGDNYSPICLAPIGECVIQAGLNEITYKRIGSYNLIISELVFIGSEFEHTHAAASEWSSDETGHWHACTALGCPTGKADAVVAHTLEEVAAEGVAATCKAEGKKVEKCSVCGYKKETSLPKLDHTLGEAYDVVPATCEAAGSQKKKCSVCDEVITEVLPKTPHNFGDAVDATAAGEGYIATTAHNCSVCGKSALRWKATDYDATKTADRSTAGPESRDNGKAIRWSSTPNFSGGDATVKGCHIVYNVKIAQDVTNVGLAFETSRRTDINTIFDKNEGDNSKGYEYVNGELVRPDSRYGLKVDGNVILIEKDNSGQTWKDGINWYTFPVTIPSLTAGIHEIELYNLGGYRAEMYNFQLVGLPHAESSHTHTLGDWQSDDNNHWKVCSGEGCPAGAGAHLEEAPHTWVDGAVAVDGTKATQTITCSVCGKSSSLTGGAYGTFAWKDALQGAGTVGSDGKVSAGDNNLLVFEVPAAGTYVVTLQMQGSSGNEARVLNGDGHGYAIYANGVKGTFLGEGKTYAEFFGENQTAWVDVAFGEVQLVEGKNEIKVSALSSYYRTRINPNSNVTIAPKA